MNEEEAKDFYHNWIWNSNKRKTDGMGWPAPYRADVINMLIDATKPKPQKKNLSQADKRGLKLTQCKACK